MQWLNLEYLRAQGEMPDFGKCPNLKTFAWYHGFVHCFGGKPEGATGLFDLPIDCLRKLENLNVYGGALLNLDFLHGMPNLKNLALHCDFNRLPDCLGAMAHLEEISISHASSLECLPESLADSKTIKRVSVSHSGISEIPGFLKDKNIEIEILVPCRR